LFLLVHDKKEKQTAPHGCYTWTGRQNFN
jgi:hypothetical protein